MYKKIEEKYKYIIGIDEVGRGPFAGPLYISLFATTFGIDLSGMEDSKKLKEKDRQKRKEKIDTLLQDKKGFINLEIITNNKIDSLGLATCINSGVIRLAKNFLNIHNLSRDDCYFINDYGLKLNSDFNWQMFVKADIFMKVVSTASIYAKVERDNYMKQIHQEFPLYNWDKNSGYGTKSHCEAIKKFGLNKYHRKSFLKNIITKDD